MFHKEASNRVKNENELVNIAKEKLFISKSKYAYDVDEIIDYYQGKGKYFAKDRTLDQNSGILRDFKNTKKEGPHYFTKEDVQTLMNFPEFFEAFQSVEYYEELANVCSFIKPDTVILMGDLVDAASYMEYQHILYDEDRLTSFLLEPANALFQQLKKDLSEFPKEEKKERQKERHAVHELTKQNGLLNYHSARGQDLISDLTDIIQNRKCASGFNRHLANLYGTIISHQYYRESLSNLKKSPSP
jgi:hypothetical protein